MQLDREAFPDFDEYLRFVRQETECSSGVAQEDRSILDFDGPYVLNERLARLTGFAGLRGPNFGKWI
jgi:hypothetical protein